MLPLLGACSWAGPMAQDSVEGAASYYGREHFTLKAQVPANFGFVSKAQYAPREGQDCSFYSPELGGNMTRRGQKTDRAAAKATEQSVSFEIPFEYHIAGCAMDLTGVDYEVNGTYGSDAWDHGMDQAGGLSVLESLPASAPGFTPAGVQESRGLCTWVFQISTARAKKGQIEKILNCSAANEQWQISADRFKRGKPGGAARRNELPGKTVKVVFRLNPEERPRVVI